MIWLPLVLDFSPRRYDFVFVDEVQDLNKSQFELIKKMCNGKTRIIAVGDSRQSIYAFRGADTNSMRNFKEYFKAKELPLSICYRCPTSVINLAKQFVPQIEPFERAPKGTVEHITENDLDQKAKPGDLIICRTNAPLVKVAFSFIRQHRKAIIRGRDIGKNLIKIVDSMSTSDIDLFTKEVNRELTTQTEKLAKIERGELPRKQKSSIVKKIDQLETILAISENCTSLPSLKQTIKDIFSDKEEGIILSSVHKVKGLESKRIFILYYNELMPHPMAETEEEQQQEINIKYVAVTRAKEELYLVDQDVE
jgi:superfamily I DNA/RNA helicase